MVFPTISKEKRDHSEEKSGDLLVPPGSFRVSVGLPLVERGFHPRGGGLGADFRVP